MRIFNAIGIILEIVFCVSFGSAIAFLFLGDLSFGLGLFAIASFFAVILLLWKLG